MSSDCSNCDCADKGQCVKKGSNYTADIVEAEKSFVVMKVRAAAKNDRASIGGGAQIVTPFVRVGKMGSASAVLTAHGLIACGH